MPLYVGVNGVARKAKKLYVGVNDVARKIKRAYIGVDGVAKLFFTADPALFSGVGPQMNASHFNHGLAKAGNYIVCAGGTSAAQNVDAFNEDGVLSSVEALPENVSYVAGATASDDTAVFAGGIVDNATRVARVYRYTKNLVRGELSSLQSPRGGAGAARVGSYVLIAGGVDNSGKQDDVDAYNINTLARTTAYWMYALMDAPIGAESPTHALFGGGYVNTASQASTSVTAYSTTLVRTEPTGLSLARYLCAGATAGSRALFVGGNTGGGGTSAVDAYDASLVRTTAALPSSCAAPAGGALAGMGIVVNTEDRTTQFFDESLLCKQGESFEAGASVSNTRVGVPLGARLWFARGATTLYTYFA